MTIVHLKTTALSDGFASFGKFTTLFGKLLMSRRMRQERDRAAAVYTDLIENADDYKLYDLGCTRADLFRMRAELYE